MALPPISTTNISNNQAVERSAEENQQRVSSPEVSDQTVQVEEQDRSTTAEPLNSARANEQVNNQNNRDVQSNDTQDAPSADDTIGSQINIRI